MNELVPIRGARTPSTARHGRRSLAVPAAIAGAGDTAVRRFLEFFAATIRNKNTRMAYYRAVTDFFTWLDAAGIVALVDIEPLHVATYIEALQERMAKPTVKQHLAAIRMLFDWLVTGGILAGFHGTKRERYSIAIDVVVGAGPGGVRQLGHEPVGPLIGLNIILIGRDPDVHLGPIFFRVLAVQLLFHSIRDVGKHFRRQLGAILSGRSLCLIDEYPLDRIHAFLQSIWLVPLKLRLMEYAHPVRMRLVSPNVPLVES
jgi:hypothetical protein